MLSPHPAAARAQLGVNRTAAGPPLLTELPLCGKLWNPIIDSEWWRITRGMLGPKRKAGRVRLRSPDDSEGLFEPYVWAQCVPDSHYELGGKMDHTRGDDHRHMIRHSYRPECWENAAPGECRSDDSPTRPCLGCRLPIIPLHSRHYAASHWQSFWTVEADDLDPAGASEAGSSTRARRHLRSFLHTTHNRGPFHWVPWLEMFDWLLLQMNPSTYERLDRLMRRSLFWKWSKIDNLPFVAHYLVRQRNPPRTVFMPTPLLPYFVRFFLHLLPSTGVAVYVGRGWQEGWPPPRWLEMLANHPKILHVFTENPRIRHPKITAMPIGIDPTFIQADAGQELKQLVASISLDGKRVDRLLGGWAVTGPIREAAHRHMLSRPWCKWFSTRYAGPYGIRQVEYWRHVSKYAFMMSPPSSYRGEGPDGPIGDADSYRTFEALMLKMIPILWEGPNSWAWEGLPVVTVTNWSQVTPANLRRWWREKRHMLEGPQPWLRTAFWWSKIERVVNQSLAMA